VGKNVNYLCSALASGLVNQEYVEELNSDLSDFEEDDIWEYFSVIGYALES
jgi:hypothetical protein